MVFMVLAPKPNTDTVVKSVPISCRKCRVNAATGQRKNKVK